MSETLTAEDEALPARPAIGLDRSCSHRPEAVADLRRVGINPNFWYPVAISKNVRREKTFA